MPRRRKKPFGRNDIWLEQMPLEPKPMHWQDVMEASYISRSGEVYVHSFFGVGHTVRTTFYDGMGTVLDNNGQRYVPIDWLIKQANDPSKREIFEGMKTRILKEAERKYGIESWPIEEDN